MTADETSPAVRKPTAIDAVAEKWVETLGDLMPTLATYIGLDRGKLGEWEDFSPAGHDATAAAAKAVIAELEPLSPADDVDAVTKDDLLSTLKLEIEKHDLDFHLRDVNVLASPVQTLRETYDIMPTDTEDDWANVSSRLNTAPTAIDQYIETLRLGIERGVVPAKRQVLEVILQCRESADPDGLFAGLVGGASGISDGLSSDLRKGALASAAAYGTLADFFEKELLPAAGEKDAVGRDLYAVASRSFLGATVDLDETYEWGVDELQRMVDEQTSIANEIKPGASVEEAIELLERWMQETSDRAVEELGRSHFDIPKEIRTLECMIAPNHTGVIYYTGPTDDFSRPGRMWWSVPEGVTEFNTWRELTTVYHEGVPGHHLQIAEAVYNRVTLNSYRMRAARVVLDIGVHLEKQRPDGKGPWTGDYAFDFMARHVHMSPEFVRFEVNRYLGWPGQAPSYKVGQRIWEQIRDEYKAREGAAFSAKAFHKKALDLGGIGLDTLKDALLK
jgi:uncharacterized protein (DUF885 family)